jgi:hypothetical protein
VRKDWDFLSVSYERGTYSKELRSVTSELEISVDSWTLTIQGPQAKSSPIMSVRHRDRSRSSSPGRLPKGVKEITERDFFLKHDAFNLWLREEKDKVLLQ